MGRRDAARALSRSAGRDRRRSGARRGDALRAARAADRRAPRGAARARAHRGAPHLRDGARVRRRSRAPCARAAPTRRCSSSGSTRWWRLFVLWSGLAVLVLARRRAGAVAYAAWSVGTFVFMVTFYDYHSTAWLAPLFSLSTVSFPAVRGLAGLFVSRAAPRPAPRAARGRHRVHGVRRGRRRRCSRSGRTSPFPRRLDLRPLRVAVSAVALSSLLVLSISILYRLRVERGRRRQELLSSALGLAAVPALIAIGLRDRGRDRHGRSSTSCSRSWCR